LASGHIVALIDEAGAPAGLVNSVPVAEAVRAGEQFMSDKRVAHVSFTGSVESGKVLARLGSRNLVRLTLELGGQNPFHTA
jgi:succinate-semialdehyde dehydrogenase/glutarate-semialdehyde dehydrogenase